jgi:hypothetical protein
MNRFVQVLISGLLSVPTLTMEFLGQNSLLYELFILVKDLFEEFKSQYDRKVRSFLSSPDTDR